MISFSTKVKAEKNRIKDSQKSELWGGDKGGGWKGPKGGFQGTSNVVSGLGGRNRSDDFIDLIIGAAC